MCVWGGGGGGGGLLGSCHCLRGKYCPDCILEQLQQHIFQIQFLKELLFKFPHILKSPHICTREFNIPPTPRSKLWLRLSVQVRIESLGDIVRALVLNCMLIFSTIAWSQYQEHSCVLSFTWHQREVLPSQCL